MSLALIGRRAVFLDLRRDRYVSLDRSTEDLLHAVIAGEPLAPPQVERLLGTGLFREAATPAPVIAAATTLAEASLLDRERAAPSLTGAVRAFAATASARRRLRRVPLLSLIEKERGRRAGAMPDDAEMLAQASLDFLAARALAPIAPKCLPDSLALLDWLSRSGLHPALVFGVKLDPFAAHCWLQSGSLVLNDAADIVAAFTPVLVVQ